MARQPNPSRVDLSNISGDYDTMFQSEDPSPLWRPIPIHIEPFQVEDGVTSDVEVKAEVSPAEEKQVWRTHSPHGQTF